MAQIEPIIIEFLMHPDLAKFTLFEIPGRGYQAAALVRGETGWKVRYGTSKEMALENVAMTFLADRNGASLTDEI
jgi:hypothetical protein